jgi:hypothetical protein
LLNQDFCEPGRTGCSMQYEVINEGGKRS